MSTSGSIDFTQTRDQIISNALSLIGVLAAGETATSADITFASGILNAMIKAWMAQGIHLWTEEEGTIYLVNGQTSYNLQSGASGANASDGTGTPIETTLSAAAPSGATSITVTSSTGMAISDNIGIQQSDNTMKWTTISSIASTTIGLNSALTANAASGALVATYTTQLGRPLSIQSVRLRNAAGFDRPVWIKPRNDYMMIPQKSIAGSPNIVYYTPQITNGIIYLWPTPNNVGERLKITYLRTIQDFDSANDNPDFPVEWIEAITYNLALRLAPAFERQLSSGGMPGNPDLIRMAAQFLEELKAWDAEQPYVQIVPNRRH